MRCTAPARSSWNWCRRATRAERIRAAGAGIGGFFTPTGYGTPLTEGKETGSGNGRGYVLERALPADVALVHARARRPLGQPHLPPAGATSAR